MAATQIGLALGPVQRSIAAAMVAAGLVSVVLFPALALAVSRSGSGPPEKEPSLNQPAGGQAL